MIKTSIEYFNTLSIEEKDRIILKDLKQFGFVKNECLVESKDCPKREELEYVYKDGTIKIINLPEDTETFILISTKDKPVIFTKMPTGLDHIYTKSEKVEIKNPIPERIYDLKMLSKNPSAWNLDGTGTVKCYNNLVTPTRFQEITNRMIDIILLRDGNIRIDLINQACENLSFCPSEYFDNALDINLNTTPKIGNIFLSNVKSGLVVNHPVLSQALKLQAELGIIDRYNELFYGHVIFCCQDDYGKRFFDFNRLQQKSSFTWNMELLSCTNI